MWPKQQCQSAEQDLKNWSACHAKSPTDPVLDQLTLKARHVTIFMLIRQQKPPVIVLLLLLQFTGHLFLVNYTMPAYFLRNHSPDGATLDWEAGIKCSLILVYRPRRDERLSWPDWLTGSGRLTHTNGHPTTSVQALNGHSTDPNQCPGLVSSSSTTGFLPLYQLPDSHCYNYHYCEWLLLRGPYYV